MQWIVGDCAAPFTPNAHLCGWGVQGLASSSEDEDGPVQLSRFLKGTTEGPSRGLQNTYSPSNVPYYSLILGIYSFFRQNDTVLYYNK